MMNRLLIVCMVFLCVLPKNTLAQDSRQNILKINPISLVACNISTFYERGISERSSAQLGLNYMNANIINIPISGYGLGLEYRYHFKKNESKTPNGFYTSPFGRYSHYALTLPLNFKNPADGKQSTITTSFSATNYNGGIEIGYEHTFNNGLGLDLFLGPFYSYTSFGFSSSYSIISIPFFSFPASGVGLRAGLCFGFGF